MLKKVSIVFDSVKITAQLSDLKQTIMKCTSEFQVKINFNYFFKFIQTARIEKNLKNIFKKLFLRLKTFESVSHQAKMIFFPTKPQN